MIRTFIAGAIFSTIAFAATAAQEPKAAAIAVGEAEAVVEVVNIDRQARSVIVRGPSGGMLLIAVPPEAQNLDRVKVGDLFKMRYLEAVALALHKGGSAAASESQTVELAPKGGTPGGKVVNTKQMTTVVTAVDRPTRTISVSGPEKNVVTFKVSDAVRSYDEIAVGDTIAVTYTEALALEMISDPNAKR